MKRPITLILLLILLPALALAQSIHAPRLHVLDNGLRVITVEDHSNPLVSTVWSVHVGDSAEPPDFAGNSHYLEHLLLFRGTDKYPKNEIGEWVAGRGGYFNGGTWYDWTTYVIMSSVVDLEAALDRHEQMMFHAAFSGDDFETEKKAVFEELRSGLDTPYGYLYGAGSYHMYPEETFYSRDTIGSIETVQAATVERVRRYYKDYYVPNNMTLAIVGDIDTDAVIASVRSRLGHYAPAEVPDSLYEPVSMMPGINLVTEERDVGKAYFLLTFEGPRAGTPDFFPYLLLSEYLAGGQTSLLRSQVIVEQQLLDNVYVSAWPRRYAKGWQAISGETETAEVADAVNAIWLLLEEVKRAGIPNKDFGFARKRLLTAHREALDDQYQVADELVTADAHDDYTLFSKYEESLAKVTLADVQAVANKYFLPQNFFLMSIFPPGTIPENFEQDIRINAAALSESASGVQASVLKSGVTLIAETRPGAAIESFTVAIRAGDRAGDHAGQAEAVATMLARETEARSKSELQNYLDEQGFGLSSWTDQDGAYISLQLPAGAAENAMQLLTEILTAPGFTEKEWDDAREEMIAALASATDRPRSVAWDMLNETVYEGTPYGRSMQQAQDALPSLTTRDLRSFWKKHYKTGAIAVAYVGAASSVELARGFESLALLSGKAPAEAKIGVKPFTTALRRANPMAGKAQANLYMAWSAPELQSDAWVLWQLAQKAIGGDLAGRLWKLRQDEGLAYSVWLAGTTTRHEPLTHVYMATAGEKREAALAAIHREIGRARDGLAAEELERVKVSYLASMNRYDRTAARRTARQAAWWIQEHPPMRRADLERIIAGATLDAVNQVIRDVLDPDNYVLVEAGMVPE